jgi:hypothetical protein
MHDRLMRCGPVVARVYAALVYLVSLTLLYGAAVLTSTHARDAFIFIFLPGVLFAVLAMFIWTASRSAMILTFAASAALQLMSVGNMPESWGYLLPIPVLFGLLTAFGLAAPVPRRDSGAEPRVADEVYAAVVYFTALLAVFMAPFNHSRQFGLQAVGLYALLLGVVLGGLAVLIWRGKIWAMIAAFALSLAHWIALASINPWLWSSPPYLAAPVVSGILTVVCISFAAKARRRRAAVAILPVPASE